MSVSGMPDWDIALRNALVTPGPVGRYWHRPSDWTIEQAVETMRAHMTLPDILDEADAEHERRRRNWPHHEPFEVVDGRCVVCGYRYEEVPA